MAVRLTVVGTKFTLMSRMTNGSRIVTVYHTVIAITISILPLTAGFYAVQHSDAFRMGVYCGRIQKLILAAFCLDSNRKHQSRR